MLVLFSKFVSRVRGCSTEGLEGPLARASEFRLASWVQVGGLPLDPTSASPPPYVTTCAPLSIGGARRSGPSKACPASHSHAGDRWQVTVVPGGTESWSCHRQGRDVLGDPAVS